MVESQFQSLAKKTRVAGMKLVPLSEHQAAYDQAVKGGAVPTIRPVGWMVVEYESIPVGGTATATLTAFIIFGKKGGRYFLGS